METIKTTIDFKVTAWERICIPDEFVHEIKGKLASGEFKTSQDVFIFLEGKTDFDENYQVIPDSEVQLTPDQNDGMPTIEMQTILSGEKGVGTKILWKNTADQDQSLLK